MGKNNRHSRPTLSLPQATAAAAPDAEPEIALSHCTFVQMRLSPGIHAVVGTEVEIIADGSRIAGGNGIVEFNLWGESWVTIRFLR